MTLKDLIEQKKQDLIEMKELPDVIRYLLIIDDIAMLSGAHAMLVEAEQEEQEKAARKRGRRTKSAAEEMFNGGEPPRNEEDIPDPLTGADVGVH